MATTGVCEDFCLRGNSARLRQPPKALTNSDLTLTSPVAAVLTSRARPRDPSTETYFRRHVEFAEAAEQPAAAAQHPRSRSPELPPPPQERWFLSPPHLRAAEFPVNRLDGLPARPAAPEDRREGLLGGLLAASDISRAAALTGGDVAPNPSWASATRPVDYDPLAAAHFPVTLGASFRVREQIELAAADSAGGPAAALTFSPPGSGLPYPEDPWRPRTPHNAAVFESKFRSVGDHLADTVPRARQRQREFLMAERAPATASAEVFVSSPYSVELAQLRMQRLRIEEQILLEVKRQQELERTAPPKDRWYALRTPQFHYEARKNAQAIRGSSEDPQFHAELDQYRQQLLDKSAEFRESVEAYSRLRSS